MLRYFQSARNKALTAPEPDSQTTRNRSVKSTKSVTQNLQIYFDLDYIISKFYFDTLFYNEKRNVPQNCKICTKRRNKNVWGLSDENPDQIYRHHVYPKETFPDRDILLDVCGSCHGFIHDRIREIKKRDGILTEEGSIEALKMTLEHYNKKVCRYCKRRLDQNSKKCRRPDEHKKSKTA